MLQITILIAPLFGLMVLGFISGRVTKLPLEGVAWLNFFVIYIALPALFFKLLSQNSLVDFSGFAFIAITTVATLLIFCLCFFAASWVSYIRRGEVDIGEATIQGFAGAYGNVGYMGPPLAIVAFGPAAIVPAAMIFAFDNALHFILAPMLMALKDQGEGKAKLAPLVGKIIWKIISHPFILATIAGFSAAAFSFVPPTPVASIVDMLAGAAAPCALFMMGVSAALRPLRRVPIELSWLVPIKLIVHPALVWFMLTTLGEFPPVFVQTAVLLAALPSAANVFVLAQQYGVWQERASSAVIVSTIVSIVTLTLTLYVLKNGFVFG